MPGCERWSDLVSFDRTHYLPQSFGGSLATNKHRNWRTDNYKWHGQWYRAILCTNASSMWRFSSVQRYVVPVNQSSIPYNTVGGRKQPPKRITWKGLTKAFPDSISCTLFRSSSSKRLEWRLPNRKLKDKNENGKRKNRRHKTTTRQNSEPRRIESTSFSCQQRRKKKTDCYYRRYSH